MTIGYTPIHRSDLSYITIVHSLSTADKNAHFLLVDTVYFYPDDVLMLPERNVEVNVNRFYKTLLEKLVVFQNERWRFCMTCYNDIHRSL